ncbi:hypothetical protein SMD44_p10194 (plasmid) [Streptomyces alboflavus]|uniref:2'-5' RNA ligase n=1 Tax=Streptomyces alboflavus TaxID=67267 RepID=A0A291W462_9ACTN|nr:hypothetical protein SMD44_p10194 [Streptomyces alboflavus]
MADFFHGVTTRTNSWPPGRRDLHWHLIPDAATVRTHLSGPYSSIIHRPGLGPVAPQWAHVTVLHSGPVEEFLPGEVEAVTERVRRCLVSMPPIELTFDRPSVGGVAVECAGRPGAAARRLWEVTAAATAAVVGDRFPLIPAQFYPHLSLAYGTGGAVADRREMKALLSDRPGEPLTMRFDQLSRVEQWHDMRSIRWSNRLDLPLAG